MKRPKADARMMVRAALMAAATAVLAQIAVPLPGNPVPVTLQVLGVLLSGLLLPPSFALQSQVAYVALGAVGAPVFAGGAAGPGVLAGPTGGYLWGFIAAAWVTSRLSWPSAWGPAGQQQGLLPAFARLARDIGAAAAGVLCVYVPGVLQLAMVARLSLAQALSLGMLPFVGWDLAKAVTAALLAPALRRAIIQSAAPAPSPRASAPGS